MAKELLGIALTADTDSVKLAAIRDALDRAGLRAPSEVVLSQGEPKAFEQVFDSIGGSPGVEFPSVASEPDLAGLDAQTPPAPAFNAENTFGSVHADAGEDSDSAGEQGQQPSHHAPPRQPRPRTDGRDRQPQPRELHITGEAAIRLANEANRQVGALPPLPELESPHRRYRRP